MRTKDIVYINPVRFRVVQPLGRGEILGCPKEVLCSKDLIANTVLCSVMLRKLA